MLSVLLQELALAREYGRKRVLFSSVSVLPPFIDMSAIFLLQTYCP
jgi:hypothetical protein